VGLTAIYGPNGKRLAGPLDPNEEGMVFAEIDVEKIIDEKLQHDIVGHYNRFDVLSLNLNRRPLKPIWDVEGREERRVSEMKEEEIQSSAAGHGEKIPRG
jgi:hypothetical protein